MRALNALLAATLTLGLAANAAAQTTTTAPMTATPTFDMALGYQFVHVNDQNFPFGINFSGVRNFENLGLVAEVGWSMDSDNEFDVDVDTNMFNFGAGPRWTGFGSGRTWPYAQVIVGGVVARSSVEFAGVDSSDSESSFMLQPGVGATFVMGDGWGLFGQVDYRRTFFDEPDDVDESRNNQFRVLFGARMILD